MVLVARYGQLLYHFSGTMTRVIFRRFGAGSYEWNYNGPRTRVSVVGHSGLWMTTPRPQTGFRRSVPDWPA